MIDPEGEIFFSNQLEDAYENMLDDCYDEVDICGYKYNPSRALKETDPIAFNCGLADYKSSLLGEGWSEGYLTLDEIEDHREKVKNGEWQLEED